MSQSDYNLQFDTANNTGAVADDIIDAAVQSVVQSLQQRFDEAKRNIVQGRPVASAAKGLLDGSLNITAEVARMTGVEMNRSGPQRHKPILLIASKFGTWASELTLVAGVLLKAGYEVCLGTEDGSVPHLLGPSMDPGMSDGAWRISVVSEEERDLAHRFLRPGSPENEIFRKDNIVDLSKLAKPPQVGDYLNNPALMSEYRVGLKNSMAMAKEFDALCIAGGSGAIPGLMFDRGLHALILAFHKLQKPIMGECNGGLAILQTLDPDTGLPILAGRAVTTHSMLDEYQGGWGWTQPFDKDPASFWKDGHFDLPAYSAAETWYQPGMTGNPLVDSENSFRNAAGADGVFFSPAGSPYSVVVDDHIITCRTTPDGYPGALCLMAVLDGLPPLRGRLFIHADQLGGKHPI